MKQTRPVELLQNYRYLGSTKLQISEKVLHISSANMKHRIDDTKDIICITLYDSSYHYTSLKPGQQRTVGLLPTLEGVILALA